MLFKGYPGKREVERLGYKSYMILGMPLSIVIGAWLLKKALRWFRRRRGLQDDGVSDSGGTATSDGPSNTLNARGPPVYLPKPAQGTSDEVRGISVILPASASAPLPLLHPDEDQLSTTNDLEETYTIFSEDELSTISDSGDSSVLNDDDDRTNESYDDSGFDEDNDFDDDDDFDKDDDIDENGGPDENDGPDEDDGKRPATPSNNPPTPALTQPGPVRIIRLAKSLIKDVIPPYRDRNPGKREDLLGLRVRVVGAGLPHKGLYGRVRDFRIGEQDAWVEIDRDMYWAFLYQTDALQVIDEDTGLDVAAGPGLAW